MTTSLLIPKASTMRFAVIGCGVIGRMHAASIAAVAPEAELALAVDELPERARAIADMYGAQAATSITDALTRSGIDAVAICAPSGHHADLAIAALEAGKHVIVEKPGDESGRGGASRAPHRQRDQPAPFRPGKSVRPPSRPRGPAW